VVQNLYQICVFKIANETGKPWLWWDYVHDFALRCPMKDKKYTPECAHDVIKSLGMSIWQCFHVYLTFRELVLYFFIVL
jgi:hypothetical protein